MLGGICAGAVRGSRGGSCLFVAQSHRVAISNRRLITFDEIDVTIRYNDNRRDGCDRQHIMALADKEFTVVAAGLPSYPALRPARKTSALTPELLPVAAPVDDGVPTEQHDFRPRCPCSGGRMIVIEMFEPWKQPRGPPDATATNRDAFLTNQPDCVRGDHCRRQGRGGPGPGRKAARVRKKGTARR